MTALTITPPASPQPIVGRAWSAVKNTFVLTKRSIARIAASPSNCSMSRSSR